jgi:hypothetical protein
MDHRYNGPCTDLKGRQSFYEISIFDSYLPGFGIRVSPLWNELFTFHRAGREKFDSSIRLDMEEPVSFPESMCFKALANLVEPRDSEVNYTASG